MTRFTEKLLRPLDPADFAGARDARDFSKACLDILKNVVLLGAIKYAADRTKVTALESLYWVACSLFMINVFSYIQPWRIRLTALLFERSSLAQAIDVLINTMGLLILQIVLFLFVNSVSEQLASSH
jgi:hypothetical protein